MDDHLIEASCMDVARLKTQRMDEIKAHANVPNKGWAFSGEADSSGVLKGVVSHVEHIDRIVLTLILACRLLLDNVARIFNPAGLLCPILVLAKLLMRMICCGKITNWNDPDPDDSAMKWMCYCSLLELENVKFPRSIWPDEETISVPSLVLFSVQLHTFFGN